MLSCFQIFCDLTDCGPPGFPVRGIFQTRVLEWVAISFPPAGDLPDPGIELPSTASPFAGGFFITEPPGKPTPETGSQNCGFGLGGAPSGPSLARSDDATCRVARCPLAKLLWEGTTGGHSRMRG